MIIYFIDNPVQVQVPVQGIQEKMKFESVLPLLGEFGRYQKRIYFLICLPAILCAMHKLAWVFLGARVDHRCQLPFENQNSLYDQIHFPTSNVTSDFIQVSPSLVYPYDSKANKWSQCSRYDLNYTQEYFFNGTVPPSGSHVVSCDNGKYIYNREKYKSSVVMEYNLVCDRKSLHAHAQSTFMVGILLGSIIFGDLSDRFGRRPIFFLSLVLQVLFGILAGIVPDLYTFIIARMLVGASTSGIFLVGFVISMEMVGTSYRVLTGVICQLFFTAGYLVTAIFAYFIRDWKMLQIALSLPGLAFLSYYFFLPESMRWLLVKGRKEEAKIILRKAAKENGVTLSPEVYDSLHEDSSNEAGNEEDEDGNVREKKGSVNLLHLVRYPKLLLRSINIFFSWLVNSGVYYGLSLYTSNLGGNDFINFGLAGAVEVPAYLFLIFTLNRAGRKLILSGCLLAGGVAMAACAIIPEDMNWLLITFAMIGKLCITASYGVIYILTAESFPTVIRNSGVGCSSMFARVGGILSSYLLILGDVWKPLPIIIFGSASLLAGFLALFIPETLGKRLPETLEDGENFGSSDYEEKVEVEMANNGNQQNDTANHKL